MLCPCKINDIIPNLLIPTCIGRVCIVTKQTPPPKTGTWQVLVIDRGPKMETLPHPRDFMRPKWQDRVSSRDLKSAVCKMKCSALRFYATLSAKRSHIYMVGSGCGCLSVKQSFHQLCS